MEAETMKESVRLVCNPLCSERLSERREPHQMHTNGWGGLRKTVLDGNQTIGFIELDQENR